METRVAGKDLPAASYAVLGLVSFGETSGYDLKRFADGSISYFFWSPASSQIYAELRRLASLGYVREREVEQERRPDKRLYRITRDGEQALRRWLESGEVTADVHKSLTLLKLFFGRHTTPETLIAHLDERLRQVRQGLAEFEEIERHIAESGDHFFPYMTLKSGIAHTHAELQWLESAIEELNTKSSQESSAE